MDFKRFAMELSSPVALIFNASIQERTVPNAWKVADSISIRKINPLKDIEKDLGPISLTSVLSKTMERFVAKWIMSQIRQLIDLNQFGSLAGLSTTHALLSLVHLLYKVTDQRDQCVRVLLLDFSKAFDRINHNILRTKMKDMAIDPTLIEWVRSFLTNRRVRIGNSTSNYQQVNGGVPQGTVLGPILFMIMINDLLKEWESRWKYLDDTTLSETVAVNDQSVLKITLDGIYSWCEENDMVLNARKCKEILICFWKKKHNFQQLTVNDYPVEQVKSAKLFGLILSSDLKWNEHVVYIVKKSSRRLYILRLLKRAKADTKRLITVYISCIRAILEYCNQIWHFNIQEYLSKDIEKIQHRALEIIHPSLSYYDALWSVTFQLCIQNVNNCARHSLKIKLSQSLVCYQVW
jgi:retron-type reverse transcriptase